MDDETLEVRRAGPRWRRWWLALGLVAVLGAPWVLLLVAPVVFPPRLVSRWVVSALTDALHAPVEIEGLDYHPLWGISVDRLTVGPPEGFRQDVLQATGVRIRYVPAGALRGCLVFRNVTVESLAVTVEEVARGRNVDALGASKSPGEAVDRAFEPVRGPLLPLDVVVEALSIGPASFTYRSRSASLFVDGIRLSGGGTLGGKTSHVSAALSVEPGAADNVRARRGPVGHPETRARWAFNLGVQAEADTGDRPVLRDLRVAGRTALERVRLAERAGTAVPSFVAELQAELQAEQDVLTIRTVSVDLDGVPALRARGGARGLWDAVEVLGGAGLGRVLGAQLGLAPSDGSGDVRLDVATVDVDLTRAAPLVGIVRPGLRTEGRLVLRGGLRAPWTTLRRAPFAGMAAELQVDGVSYVDERAGLVFVGMHGRVGVEEPHPPGAGHLRVDAQLTGDRVAVPGFRATSAGVRLRGTVAPGFTPTSISATLAVSLDDLRAGRVRAAGVSAALRMDGTDAFVARRAEARPLRVYATTEARRFTVPTGPTASDRLKLFAARVDLELRPDRLFRPSRAAVPASVRLGAGRIAHPAFSVRDFVVRGEGEIDDPRRPGADGAMDIASRWQSLRAGDVSLARTDVRLGLGYRQLALERGGAAALPAGVDLTFDVNTAAVRGRRALAGLDASAILRGRASADLRAGRVTVSKVVLRAPRVLDLRLEGEARRIFSAVPRLRADFRGSSDDLGALVRKGPRGLWPEAEDAAARGRADLAVRFDGPVSASGPPIDVAAPPVDLEVVLRLADAGFRSEALGTELDGIEGTTRFTMSRRGVEIQNDLRARFLSLLSEGLEGRFEQVEVRQRFGLVDRVFDVDSNVEAERILARGERVATAAGTVDGFLAVLKARHAAGEALRLQEARLQMPGRGVDIEVTGVGKRGPYGVFMPELTGRAVLDADHLRGLWPAIGPVSGRVEAGLRLVSESAEQIHLEGRLTFDDFSYAEPGRFALEGATGRVPVEQRFRLPPPVFDAAVAGVRGAMGNDLEARMAELGRRLAAARAVLDDESILAVAPRSADHVALAPYRRARGADLRARRLQVGKQTLESVRVEALWRAGVLQVDRLQASLWDGDVLADFAAQLPPDLDVKARLRGTMTNLNVDVPYALAKGIEPVADPDAQDDYRTSGTMDITFALRDRAVDGRVDVVRLSLPLVERMFGAVDPSGESSAVAALDLSESVGVRPVSATVWIAESLLNVQFDWDRLWLHVHYRSWNPLELIIDTALIVVRPILIPTLGGLYVIPTVNGAVRRLSLANVLEPMIQAFRFEETLRTVEPWVMGEAPE